MSVNDDVKRMLQDPAMQGQVQGMQQALLLAQLYQSGDMHSKVVTGNALDAVKAFNELKNTGRLPMGVPQRDGPNHWVLFYFGEQHG